MSDNGTNVSVNMLVLTHQRPLSSSSFRWENTWTQADSINLSSTFWQVNLRTFPNFTSETFWTATIDVKVPVFSLPVVTQVRVLPVIGSFILLWQDSWNSCSGFAFLLLDGSGLLVESFPVTLIYWHQSKIYKGKYITRFLFTWQWAVICSSIWNLASYKEVYMGWGE